ncbi:CCA tRNA nucleotidyltransferase [Candidatus Bathyarchaeota archaeon]|nr:CCA tRNA nucleotidyltransferase [Candidatus Bathyarchaeota archaeon]
MKIGNVSQIVLGKIVPGSTERKSITTLAEMMRSKVDKAAREAGVPAEVRINGSVAKDTWLSKDVDIDIFMRVPPTLSRKELGTVCLNIAKKATIGYRQLERFAEHPYLETWIKGTRVNIVPCYKVERGQWVSATDRTPFHTEYVKTHLSDNLKNEVRLLKRFMKGIGVYGAEIKVKGFSGYLCELLILRYQSFYKVLTAAATSWNKGVIIDLEKYYNGREDEVKKLFAASLIIVDPVDSGRNVAAAVSNEKLSEFIAASNAFIKQPNLEFFYPPDSKPIETKLLSRTLKKRGNDLLFIKIGEIKAVPDILWGQLYKTQRSLKNLLKQNDFEVLRSAVWSDEELNHIIIFELENAVISPFKKHLGPPVGSREAEKFLRKHHGSVNTVSGPWIEEGRWVVYTRRRYNNATQLVQDALANGGRDIGVAELVAKSIRKSQAILLNEKILDYYAANPDFARFFTDYLIGRPKWLG